MKKLLIVLLLVLLFAFQSSPVASYANGGGLYPFTRRHDAGFEGGQVVTLRVLDNADSLPGNFGWLSWNGSDSSDNLAASLAPPGNAGTYYNPGTPENGWTPDPSDKNLDVLDWVQGMPGNVNADEVQAQLDWHIANQTAMIIPMYDAVAGNGTNAYYRVASFAAFELQSYELAGQGKFMTGRFLRWVTNGG